MTSFPLFLGVQSAPDVGATSYETPQLYVTFIRQRSVERKLNVKSDHSDFVGVQFTFSFQSRLALASTTRRYESWGLTNRVLPRFVERNSKSRGRKEGRKEERNEHGDVATFCFSSGSRAVVRYSTNWNEEKKRKEKRRRERARNERSKIKNRLQRVRNGERRGGFENAFSAALRLASSPCSCDTINTR